MTKQNKLIVGGVVVALVGLYLYKQNKTKNEVAKLKSGADIPPLAESTPEPKLIKNTSGATLLKEDIKRGQVQVKELNFAGNDRNQISAQYFR